MIIDAKKWPTPGDLIKLDGIEWFVLARRGEHCLLIDPQDGCTNVRISIARRAVEHVADTEATLLERERRAMGSVRKALMDNGADEALRLAARAGMWSTLRALSAALHVEQEAAKAHVRAEDSAAMERLVYECMHEMTERIRAEPRKE